MLKISRESEINIINMLIDQDIISGKDLPNIIDILIYFLAKFTLAAAIPERDAKPKLPVKESSK